MSFTFTSLLNYFSDDIKTVKRGDNHFQSNDVLSLAVEDNIMRASVKASFKKNVIYKVMVSTTRCRFMIFFRAYH